MEKYDDCYVEEDDGVFSIGFNDDDESVETINNIIFFEFAVEPGDEVSEGDKLLSVEAMKGTLELASRVSGKVIKVNERIEEEPEILQDDPTMWLVKIKR